MRNCLRFYSGGAWVAPASDLEKDAIDPLTEHLIARIGVWRLWIERFPGTEGHRRIS